jgi:lipid-binding SYLF domain-containing protein
MSIEKLGIFLISGFLTAAMAPPVLQAGMDQGARPADQTIAFSIEDVRKVQQALRTRGYDPGAINGMMSSETQAAIRQFQAANNLPVTGVLDERTQAELGVNVRGPLDVMRAKPGAAPPESRERIQTPTTPEGRITATDVQKSEKDLTKVEKNLRDADEKVAKAAAVLQALPVAGGKGIPAELLGRATAVAVIPEMVVGSRGMGGRYGRGLLTERLEGGKWSAPAFVLIGGGSFGAKIGATSTALVLVFTGDRALNRLEAAAELKLGADTAAMPGPATGPAARASGMDSAVFGYMGSNGSFSGMALEGAVLNIDEQTNRNVYGQDATASKILTGAVPVNDTVRPFVNAIQKAVPTQKISETR